MYWTYLPCEDLVTASPFRMKIVISYQAYMYVCMCIHVGLGVCTRVYNTYILTHTHTHTFFVHIHVYLRISIYIHTYTNTYICIHTCIHMCLCAQTHLDSNQERKLGSVVPEVVCASRYATASTRAPCAWLVKTAENFMYAKLACAR
jgi:hypothetical protein